MHAGAPPAPRAAAGPGLYLVYLAWAMMLFDGNFFLAALLGAPLGRLATLIYLPMIALALIRLPDLLGSKRSWILYPPLALFMLTALLSLPTAPNIGFVRDAMKLLLVYYALIITTADQVRTPRQALPIMMMFVWRFLWWAIWSRGQGLVAWHPTLANYDGYGALMVQGAGICYWAGMAVKKRWQRFALFGVSAFAVIGVVASNARGAFLALIAVAGLAWLRSPRKLVTAVAMILAAGVTVAAATLLFESGAFWDEMMSSFTEGTEEGTGAQRWALWGVAIEVWKQHPIIGVGPGNVGAFASGIFQPGDLTLFPNPTMLYGFNLHNAYMQVLAEFGTVGMLAFLWMHVDFFMKNRALHTPEAAAMWAAGGGAKRFELRYLALGLEAGFLGIMFANALYANLFESWLFTAWAANRMLWGVSREPRKSASRRRRPAEAAFPTAPPDTRFAG